MQLKLGNIEIPGNQLYLVLDDGRYVHISGHGNIAVYSPESRGLGSEAYSLRLPSIEYAGLHCSNPQDVLGQDSHFMLRVEHRH